MTGISFTTRMDKPTRRITSPVFPEWVEWAARDNDGFWDVYQWRPTIDHSAGGWDEGMGAFRSFRLVCYAAGMSHPAMMELQRRLFGHLTKVPWDKSLVRVGTA